MSEPDYEDWDYQRQTRLSQQKTPAYPERYVIPPPPARKTWPRNLAIVAAIVVLVAAAVIAVVVPSRSAGSVSRQLVSTGTARGPVPPLVCAVPAGGEYPQ